MSKILSETNKNVQAAPKAKRLLVSWINRQNEPPQQSRIISKLIYWLIDQPEEMVQKIRNYPEPPDNLGIATTGNTHERSGGSNQNEFRVRQRQ